MLGEKWAGCYAGIAAGIVASLFELASWSLFTHALPGIFLRDVRFAAAIVMGPQALSSIDTFDWTTFLVATLVHFALCIVYGLILASLIRRLRAIPSLLAGSAFGLGLYLINMHGFTILFPWFEAARDWITITAHVTFGVTAAGFYTLLVKLRTPK
ncbi:MAG TPA: sodium:proline symporter [Casimicrobiaceae bacterium]|nr:sodium:proline symporter [Casimicrobiaceae bacterium]